MSAPHDMDPPLRGGVMAEDNQDAVELREQDYHVLETVGSFLARLSPADKITYDFLIKQATKAAILDKQERIDTLEVARKNTGEAALHNLQRGDIEQEARWLAEAQVTALEASNARLERVNETLRTALEAGVRYDDAIQRESRKQSSGGSLSLDDYYEDWITKTHAALSTNPPPAAPDTKERK